MPRNPSELQIDLDFVGRVRRHLPDLAQVVGAGASIASGLPNWNELNGRLLQAFLRWKHPGIDFDHTDLGRAAHIFQLRFGREAAVDLVRSEAKSRYVRMLREALYPVASVDPSPIHYEAAALGLGAKGASETFTFNFDDLLTQAINELSGRISGAPRSPPAQKLEVVHLHGKLLPNGKGEGDIILSERDFHRAASGDKADAELRELLERRHVLLIGLSLTDPRLRRQLLVRQGWSKKRKHKVFVLLPDSRSNAASDFVERLSHGLVRQYEARFWDDWNLDVGYVPSPELVAVHQRCIRLGGSAANWAAVGARFLERTSAVYRHLYEHDEQSDLRRLIERVRRLVIQRYGVSRDERLGIGGFVPTQRGGRIQLGFRLRADERPDDEFDPLRMTERRLKVGPWSGIQGAAGYAFAYGLVIEATKESSFLDANFTPAMHDVWGPARSFRSLLCIPVLDSSEWVPIGVIFLSSNQPDAFWTKLPRDEYRDLQATLRSTFRAALRYP